MQAERRHSRVTSSRRRRTRAEQVQNRRFVLTVCLLGLMLVVTATVSYSSRAAATPESAPSTSSESTNTTLDPAAALTSGTYTAELKGSSSGSVYGGPRALLTLEYDAAARTVSYKLQITSALANPSVAAVCQGVSGQSGATVFTLFPGPTVSGNFSGVLAEGSITEGDLVGPLEGGRLTDLILLIKTGEAYVTIGTPSQPVDAMRAQIK
jgi:hypothetical protein